MKTRKTIDAEIDEKTEVITTNFFTAIYETPKGRERGKNYLTPEAAEQETIVYCEVFKWKLLYIDSDILFLR